MLRLFERTRERAVEFCDRCGSVCTAACRQDAILARAREKLMVYGGRVL